MKKLRMTPRARRVVNPAMAVAIVTFISFVVHSMMLGTSAFPSGQVVAGRYLVEDHGRVIELTARQFWFSYIHGVLVVAVFAIVAALLLFFYSRGDLKDEPTTA